MKINILISLSLIAAAAQADPIEMGWIQNGDENLPIRHFLPRRPGMSSPLSVDKGESSILIEYDGDITVLCARIIDDAGSVVYEVQTSSSTLELPLPSAGDYTIEVWVDDALYVGEFSIDD